MNIILSLIYFIRVNTTISYREHRYQLPVLQPKECNVEFCHDKKTTYLPPMTELFWILPRKNIVPESRGFAAVAADSVAVPGCMDCMGCGP